MDCLIKLNDLLNDLIKSFNNNIEIGIVIPVFNRPDYIIRCFESLRDSNIHNAVLVIVDDNSTIETKKIIEEFELRNIVIHKIYKTDDRGMFVSFVMGFDYICNRFPDIKHLITLDSDTIHKRDWLDRIIDLRKSYSKETLVTGYNSTLHDTISTHDNYVIKKSCGGINMLFSKSMYKGFIRDAFVRTKNLWDWEVVKNCSSRKIPILCTRPSYIQHIGVEGLHSKSNDFARDYT